VSGNKLQLKQAGFTLVEITVAVSVMAIVGVVFTGVIAHYFVVISRNNALTEMTINSQNLLRSTVENIRYGNGVRQTNTINDPNSPVGGWNTSNTSFVIIIAVPALDASKQYIVDPGTGSPYMNELVYYKNGKKLMERILANPSAVGNRMHTTCPPASASSTCTADPELADYVKSMVFTLYDQNGATTPTPASARSVLITLSMERNAPGNPLNLTNTIRVTLRNRF
jgi:prepilin-type N-terminal cleavage/methylation domain-containing protein